MKKPIIDSKKILSNYWDQTGAIRLVENGKRNFVVERFDFKNNHEMKSNRFMELSNAKIFFANRVKEAFFKGSVGLTF